MHNRRMRQRGLVALALLVGLATASMPTTAAAVVLNVNDIVVSLFGSGEIFRIDPATNQAERISPSLSPLQSAASVALEADGNILVTDPGSAAVFRIDPCTGNVTTVARGTPLVVPFGMAVEADGNILVTDRAARAVFRIAPDGTSVTKLNSQFPFIGPIGIAVEAGGNIILSENVAFTGSTDPGAIVRFDPSTGVIVLLAELESPVGIALDADGNILVAHNPAVPDIGGGSVLRVNRDTGIVTTVADFMNSPLVEPVGVAVEANGDILVADVRAGLFRIDGAGSVTMIAPPPPSDGLHGIAVVEEVGLCADAGPDQSVNEGDVVTLDGSGSTNGVTFEWIQIAGPPVDNFDDTMNPEQPTFTAPSVPIGGVTITFSLVISFGDVLSAPDTVDITVKNLNNRPIADAGDPQMVSESAVVTLDGTNSFDPDGDPLAFSWTQTGIQTVELTGADTATPSFMAPDIVDPTGEVLTFRLVVTDGIKDSDPAFVEVTVTPVNQPPTAKIAGSPGPVIKDEGSTVILDGKGSSDLETESVNLSFVWTQVSGVDVGVDGATSQVVAFEAPPVMLGGEDLVFSLVVMDDDPVPLSSEPDQITIHVRNVNDPPTCDLADASVPTLWPPSHKMQLVEIENVMDRASDAYPTFTLDITNVTQDEPVEGLGDGDTAPDAVIQDGDPADTVLLRAERSKSGNGRVYLVSFTADDGFEICSGFVEVTVPHTRTGEPAVDDGQTFDSTQN